MANTKRTFNDLVVESLMFLTENEAKAKLELMFPKKNVSITMSDGGKKATVVVDGVKCTITTNGYTI